MLFERLRRVGRLPVLSNTLALIVLRGTTTFTRLLVLFIIARSVAPDTFGAIVFALAVVELAKVVADFGVDTLAVRVYATQQNPAELQRFTSTVLLVKLLLGAVMYAVALLYYQFESSNAPAVIVLLGCLVFTALWNNLSIDYFQARLQVRQIVAPVVTTNLGAVVALVGLAALGANSLLMLLVLPFAEALNGLVLFRAFRRAAGIGIEWPTVASVLATLRQSLPLGGIVVIATIYLRLDVLVLSRLFDEATVGYYGLAYRFTEPFVLIAAAFGLSTYSHLSRIIAEAQPPRLVFRTIMRYSLLALGYGLVACLALVSLAPLLIRLLLPAYLPAVAIVYVLAPTILFRALIAALNNAMLAYGRFSVITLVVLFNLVLIGAAMLLLVPLFGAVGAALALLIGEVLNVLIHIGLLWQIWQTQRLAAVAN